MKKIKGINRNIMEFKGNQGAISKINYQELIET